MKIGLFGGTFNPVHNGHIMLAQYCRQELSLDKVLIIPDYTPPHKDNSELLSCEHRLTMCKLAFDCLDGFEVSNIEIKRQGKSYSYQTVTEIKNLYPDDELFFLMGADMFLTLDKWKNPQIIFNKAKIAVIPRNDSSCLELDLYYKNVIKPMGAEAVILKKPVVQVSSTFIRDNLYRKDVKDKLLPENVYNYIVKNNLYRK